MWKKEKYLKVEDKTKVWKNVSNLFIYVVSDIYFLMYFKI